VWLDERGVAHTVALPNPSELMTDRFKASLDALISAHRGEVADLLERLEEEIYQQVFSIPVDPAYEGLSPPQELLAPEVWSVEDLAVVLSEIDLRWRLDCVCAMGDYLG
jgi:hypothetical protein